jgi:hypothetical protein
MAAIDYDRFVRVLTRCVELGADATLPPILGHVYKETAEGPITAFLAANKAVDTAMTAYSKENREALRALSDLDGPYRVARSAVLAMVPETVLPDTLKSYPTDTDKLNAIERLLDIVDDHAGKPWADTLLQGELGQKAPKTVKELTEAIAANKELGQVTMARAAAYGPAYEVYLRFKRVVRDTRGPGSKEYRRIHLRASPGAAGKDEAPANDTPEDDAAPGEPATPPPGDKTPV